MIHSFPWFGLVCSEHAAFSSLKQRKEWAMMQETAPALVDRGVVTPASSHLDPTALAKPQAGLQVSRLALAALWLAVGTSLSVALVALDGWLMSQSVLDTHDLPELATYVLPLPTLLTLVLAFLANRRIAKSGGALTGRGLVRGSLWLSGLTVAVLLVFAGLLLTGAGESYMCGGG